MLQKDTMADRARIPGEMVVVGSRRGPEGRVAVEADSFNVDRPELNSLPTEAQLQNRAERPTELLDEIAWISRLWSRAYEAEKLAEAEKEAEKRGEVVTEEEREAAIPDQRLVIYKTERNAGYVFRTEFGSSPNSREGIGPAQSSEKVTTKVEVDGDGHFWLVELVEFYAEDHRDKSELTPQEIKKQIKHGMNYRKLGETRRHTPLTEAGVVDIFTVPESDDDLQGYKQKKLIGVLESAYKYVAKMTMSHIKTKEDRDELLELVDSVYHRGGYSDSEDYARREEDYRRREEEEDDDET